MLLLMQRRLYLVSDDATPSAEALVSNGVALENRKESGKSLNLYELPTQYDEHRL